MRTLVISLVLLVGSAVAVSACAEVPTGSGCFYELIDGKLVAEAEEGRCPVEIPWWFGFGGGSGTTTTTLAPIAPEPGPEPAASSTSLAPAEATTTSAAAVVTTTTTAATTTTTGAAPMAPIQFTANAACRPSGLGVVLSGTGTPGLLVTISTASPYQWYYQQPSPPTAVGAGGTWSFEIPAETASWFPFAATIVSSLGESANVSLAGC